MVSRNRIFRRPRFERFVVYFPTEEITVRWIVKKRQSAAFFFAGGDLIIFEESKIGFRFPYIAFVKTDPGFKLQFHNQRPHCVAVRTFGSGKHHEIHETEYSVPWQVVQFTGLVLG